MMILEINGTDMINNPANTIFKPFVDLLGNSFFVIPISFIAVALYMKTRNLAMVGLYMMAVGVLFSGGNIFIGYTPLLTVYVLFTIIGFVALILGVFGVRRGQ